ncbi:hypothetical protein NB231_15683 [Nitrococcus mobilis Nb-231]|uniref:Uncharacterized protein n=2 Tax=Nitrococcus mobilis TaxID=35797 RepID=A4BLT7_9GAMM|nr:hypothetical protein NB231_15683 [Nitrococcus mobilis Nb-231]
MSEMMFIDVLRRHLETLPEDQTGWLAALRNRYVGCALCHLLADAIPDKAHQLPDVFDYIERFYNPRI